MDTASTLVLSLVVIALTAALTARLGPLAGGGLVLAATVWGAWLLQRRQVEVYPSEEPIRDMSALLDPEREQHQRVRWFVHMRWIAIVVAFGLILIAVPVSRLLPTPALLLLAGWWIVLVVANTLFHRWARGRGRFERQVLVQGFLDLIVLTGFLNASGGVENPVYFAYLFHVIIAGILLPRRKAFGLTATAAALFLIMAVGEYLHFLPHFTNELFPHEAEVVGGHEHPGEGVAHAAHGAAFVLGRTLPFLTLLLFSAYLTSLIADRLRRRELQLERTGRTLMLEHQRLERVVETTGVGMMLVAPDLTVPWTTGRVRRWLRLDDDSGGEPCPLYQVEGGCSVCIARETFESGSARESERSGRAADGGGPRYFRHATAPVHDADGRTIQVVELLEDVTDRKNLEAEAMHAGKLSVLGQMAAGVAHEIGNPLSSLATRLTLVERRPEPEYVKESVRLLQGQIDRIRRILHGISLFARSPSQEWSTWELNEVVSETLEMARLDGRARRVRFSAELARPSPRVNGVKDQIGQVVLNLLLNAAEASGEGDEVTVATHEESSSVRLSVRDRGPGIPREHRERLFEPFFSTKPKGTGLGLSICYSLVNAHGGSIELDSDEGGGATFTVVLPRVSQGATPRGVTPR